MNWLFENFQILLVIGLALAAWIKNRASAKEEEEAERRAREEMVRQLQELDQKPVRRTTPPPTPNAPPPVPQKWDTRPAQQAQPRAGTTPPPLREIFREPAAPEAARQKPKQEQGAYDRQPDPWQDFKHDNAATPEALSADQQALHRQEDMQQRIAELKRSAAEFRKQVGGARATQRKLEKQAKSGEADQAKLPKISRALKDPRQTRRAIVLREILGPPLGMR